MTRTGLRTQIAAAVVAVTLTATTAMAFVVYRLQEGRITDRFVSSAQAGFASDLRQATTYLPLVKAANRTAALSMYADGRLGIYWGVLDFAETGYLNPVDRTGGYIDPAGSIGPVPGQLPAALIDEARKGSTSQVFGTSFKGMPWLLIAGLVQPNLVLVEAYATQSLQDDLSQLRNQLAWIVTAVALVGAAAGVLCARGIQRPIRAAAAAARNLGDGALDTRLAVRGRDELAVLARSFNSMAARLGESIDDLRAKEEQQRRFVADVAHDLRTPVAAMIAAVDSTADRDPDVRAKASGLLGAQARRLARLVENLLEMSRLDAGVAEFLPQPVDLRLLVADAIHLGGAEADVTVHANGDTTLVGDPRRLHTVVGNLLSNATQHGAPPIRITLDGIAPDTVTIRVIDSGPGVPPDLAPVVFDRFTRGDRSRKESDGSGLGLSIAYHNVLLHGGTLILDTAG
ncbi:MAG: HAMP domain-containing histidine kinase, partial [Kutzneria sp.]|nr:HAMP domain-containing histidine kinase [Kutzneria sp.]